MQVVKLSDVKKTNSLLRAQLVRLIEVVDTPRFESEFFKVVRSTLDCDHLTAFAGCGNTVPRVIVAAGACPVSFTRSIVSNRVARYWRLDPMARTVPLVREGECVALRMAPDTDIGDAVYRRECFTQHQIVERLTLMQRRDNDVYRINFLAGPHARFAEPTVEQIFESSDLLMSLVMKNDIASEMKVPPTFADRLRVVAPTIPPREAEVCTAIMLGMTSEAIAAKLGISVNTVLTYRKRAYNRLNISCQNELMRLVLA